jgi:hypothetical protein
VSASAPAWLEDDEPGRSDASDITALTEMVGSFEPISLAELGFATLLDRVDTKFLVPLPALPTLLADLNGQYRALEVAGTRLGRYHTRYFDTPDLALYHAHQAGRLPRYKVRIRSYLESGEQYLEVKLKNNKGRTIKTRRALAPEEGTLELVRLETRSELEGTLSAATLQETLTAGFSRLTLVRRDAPERLTVDVGLWFARGGGRREVTGVAIVEIKQIRHGPADGRDALRSLLLRDATVSKYCLGVALLEPTAKKNRFKRVLTALERIEREHSLTLSA